MKKYVVRGLFLLLLSSLWFGRIAYGIPQEVKVMLNQKQVQFDVKPYIKEGSTMVPFRAVLEAMNVKVGWNKDYKMVFANNNVTRISLVVGEKTALVEGRTVKLDVPSEIRDGKTFIPLRFFSENLGAMVDWISESKTVDISYNADKYSVGSMASFNEIKVSVDSVKQDKENRRIDFNGRINAVKTLFASVVDEDENSVLGIINLKNSDGDFYSFDGVAYTTKDDFKGKYIVINTRDDKGRLIKLAQFDIGD